MPRIDLWEGRLASLIDKARDTSFEWGKHDCALFAADGVQALTGFDPASPYRGRYRSEKEAGKILSKVGGLIGLMETVAESQGWRSVEPLFAQRGDVVMAEVDGLMPLGVCTGSHFAFLMEPKGLVELDVMDKRVLMAWRIG